MTHSVVFAVRPTAGAVAFLVLQAGVGLAPTGPPGFTACQTADVEQTLFEREKSLIDPSHAMQHSHVRKHQCEVERCTRKVPGKGIEMSASKTLEDDAAAKQAVFNRNSKVSQLRSGATTLLGGLTGKYPSQCSGSVDRSFGGGSMKLTVRHSGGGRHGRALAHGQGDVLVV